VAKENIEAMMMERVRCARCKDTALDHATTRGCWGVHCRGLQSVARCPVRADVLMRKVDARWDEQQEARRRFPMEVVEHVAREAFVERYVSASYGRDVLEEWWKGLCAEDQEMYRRQARGMLVALDKAGVMVAPKRVWK